MSPANVVPNKPDALPNVKSTKIWPGLGPKQTPSYSKKKICNKISDS